MKWRTPLGNPIRHKALLALVHREQPLRNAACRVAVWVAIALVQRLLKDARVPPIIEVSVPAPANGISVGEHEWLAGYHCFVAMRVKFLSVPVHFKEYAGEGNRVFRVAAGTGVGPG